MHAAKHCAAVPPGAHSSPSISPARMALSSKPAACCCCKMMGQTDGRTQRHTNRLMPNRFIDPGLHTIWQCQYSPTLLSAAQIIDYTGQPALAGTPS